MDEELFEDNVQTGAATRLWRRAPWWRVTVVAAGLTTAVGLVSWADSPASSSANSLAGSVNPSTQNPSDGQTEMRYAPSIASTARGSSLLTSDPGVTTQVEPANESAEEQQNLAACHPHLASAPPQVPQVETQPGSVPGDFKVHFWVNGAGLVVRQSPTVTTLGTLQEQVLEQQYVQALTFSLPNTKQCRIREVELIGDFTQSPGPNNEARTMVRMYPRYYFGGDGALVSRD